MHYKRKIKKKYAFTIKTENTKMSLTAETKETGMGAFKNK